jgi:hypothetical protein
MAAGQSGTERSLKPAAATAPSGISMGHSYALMIGIDAYPAPLPRLGNPVSDARAVGAELEKDYGFEVEYLLDGNATRTNILKALTHYRNTLAENDSLLIYYAGHGDRESDESGRTRAAYWIPVDADSKESPNSISQSDLAGRIREMLTQHVLVISDSCYAGDMVRSVDGASEDADDLTLARRMFRYTSRKLMASGNDEPVLDSGGSGHSVFAKELLDGLTSEPQALFTGGQLFHERVQGRVVSKADQTPIYALIPGAGDGGGDFVFVRGGKAPVVASSASVKEVPAPTRSVQTAPAPAWVPPPRGVTPWLTSYDLDLLAIRDNPELIDRLLPGFTTRQIELEQQIWKELDSMEKGSRGAGSGDEAAANLNPKKAAFVFEWQKLIAARPDLARGPVLDVFLTPVADWSFVKREPEWSDRYNAIVAVFLFSREAIEGRNPEFAARELGAVMRKQLQMAAAKAPTSYCFTVPLPAWDYDFDAKAIRFRQQGKTAELDLIGQRKTAVFSAPAAGSRDYAMVLPASLSANLAYGVPVFHPRIQEARLGVKLPGITADQNWRAAFPMTGESMSGSDPFPDPNNLAVDRELTLSSIPVDAKIAERLMNGQSATGDGAGNGVQVRLSAEVYIDVERVVLGQDYYEGKSTPFTVAVAHLRRVEIRGVNGELIRTLDAARFRSSKDVLAAARASADGKSAAAESKPELPNASGDFVRGYEARGAEN